MPDCDGFSTAKNQNANNAKIGSGKIISTNDDLRGSAPALIV
jgi:hypothetical protein